MVEIPILNGQSIGKPQRGSIAKEYCEIMQSIFFKERIWNGTPEFTVTYPFGFLLYTNAHPEMRTFMGQEGTWDFLNSLTRKHLYIFSHRPNEAKSAILDTQENAILELFQLFGLGDVPLNPHLVLCDFNFRHTRGMRDWEHKYDAQIKTFYAFKIQHASPEEYTNLFRDTLGHCLQVKLFYELSSQKLATIHE